jgi:hypothetical protein
MLTHRDILERLGTQQSVSEALTAEGLDVGQPTISMWGTRGIPSLYWPALVKIAAERGVTLTLTELAGSQRKLREVRA